MGGSLGREDATGRGGFYCLKELQSRMGWDLSKQKRTIAVQGFGNVGDHFARLASADGWTVVAVSDSNGGMYNPNGLPIMKLAEGKTKTGLLPNISVAGPGTVPISNAALLELDVDVLVPAAIENVITEDNAARIKAPVIIELANGPVTSQADPILAQRSIVIVPDILANAGGVTVSYFEWAQNKSGYYWTVEEVRERLGVIMRREFGAVYDLMLAKKIDMRTAAYAHALQRLAPALESTGTARGFAKE
jgi:glutamate dehydrogenase (NADP+)